MSYIVISGESVRDCTVQVVEESESALADALNIAVYGGIDVVPAEAQGLLEELIQNEEISFEDGFVKLYRGELLRGGNS